ncbi:type I 3-dehydroquinate dehydratase [Companilactobacillus zhongbaensis]|uniref:type I 3-dehydroquinate dehydratase n=1 Tax=Companilactobacillus zhongbaensis TaxID=2486009 RepID=UPI000F7BA07D|nr:type I 3-dehydroquinate dehydratase [Companilactobacillus zhongbaensis]
MSVNKVQIKKITLGEGRPKIAVPITGKTSQEILDQAKGIIAVKPDLIEWRIDFFDGVTDDNALNGVGKKLSSVLGEIALLVTFRTKSEGGELELSDEKYFENCEDIGKEGYADAIDVERYHDEQQVKSTVKYLHEHGKVVIMSNHDFDKTPAEADILQRLSSMQDLDADVLKIAVMPQNVDDVLTLLSATTHDSAALKQPIITMSMGDIGKVSRISGEVFGSTLSFATVGAASAPGQISSSRVTETLNDLKLD